MSSPSAWFPNTQNKMNDVSQYAGSVIPYLRPENRSVNFGKRAGAIHRYAQRQGEVAPGHPRISTLPLCAVP